VETSEGRRAQGNEAAGGGHQKSVVLNHHIVGGPASGTGKRGHVWPLLLMEKNCACAGKTAPSNPHDEGSATAFKPPAKTELDAQDREKLGKTVLANCPQIWTYRIGAFRGILPYRGKLQ